MKKGRPESSDPRNTVIKIRLNKNELSQLELICNEYNKTKSEIIRDLIKRESYILYYGHN